MDENSENGLELTPQQQARVKQQAASILAHRRSIRKFIFDMWGLMPQGVKPVYKAEYDAICSMTGDAWEASKNLIKADWFGEPVNPERRDLDWKWYDFTKGKNYTWQQHLILLGIEKAVAGDAKRLISVVSGHGIGKSATCTWIVLWFLYCYRGAKVPVTAPTSHQMHDVLWSELSIWIKRMPKDYQVLYEWSKEYIRMAYDPEAWYARARTSTKENTEAIAGVHADHVCIVADEASGIPQQVFDTAEGALTSGNVFVLLISNGTQTTGYFYATHHQAKIDWQCFAFNGEESPMVDRGFIALKAKHGLESEEYKIRVKGGFPGEDMMDLSGYLQLIPREKIGIRLSSSELDVPFIGRVILGVDPSGEGKDKATFVLRDRFKAKVIHEMQSADDRRIAEMILTFIDRYKIDPADVVVGAFGTGADVGKEVALATANMKRPYEIYTVMEGNSPEKEEKYNSSFFRRHPDELTNPEGRPKEFIDLYLNIRALMYFRTKKWLIRGGQLIDETVDNGPFGNEIAVIRYKRALQGNRIQLMSKKDMLKMGIPSPNKGDALSLTMLRDMDDQEDTQTQEERETAEREAESVSGDDRFNAI